MIKYVCGFLFDKTTNLVVLIEKQKPLWQKDKWNAVGGKIELNETPLQAMVREFKEEAGIDIDDWKQYCTLRDSDSEIHFFYSVVDAEHIMKVKTMTIEKLGIWSIDRVNMWNFPLLPNIRWLLPMALGLIKDQRTESYDIWVENSEDLRAIEVAYAAEEEANRLRCKRRDEELELYRQARNLARP